jgi:hypothetical protein
MKGRKVPFEMADSLKGEWDPLTAEEFWSLREGMMVHVLVAPNGRRDLQMRPRIGKPFVLRERKTLHRLLLRKGRRDRRTASDR